MFNGFHPDKEHSLKPFIYSVQFFKFSTLQNIQPSVKKLNPLNTWMTLSNYSNSEWKRGNSTVLCFSWQTHSTFVHLFKSWSVTTEDHSDSDGLLQVLQLCLETSLCDFDSCGWGCLSESLRLVCKYLKYANYSLSDAQLALEVPTDRLSPSASMTSHFTWSALG